MKPHSTARVTFCLLLLTTIAGATAYVAMLTGFSAYDDEGMLMIGVKQYLGGRTLYEDVMTFYGPVYYLYNWLLHTLTGMPITHDAVRMSSLIPCLAGALICAWIVLRLTGSLVMAATAHLFASTTITVFSRAEPGHPQELVLLLLLVFASCPLWAEISHRRSLLMIALGVLAAALLLIKINVGAMLMATLALTLAARLPPGRVSRTAGLAACAGCILLPAALMKNHLEYGWARLYCWLAMTSIAGAGICVMRLQVRSPQIRPRDGCLVGAGFSLAFAGTLTIMWAQAISPAVLWDSLVVVPNRFFLQSHTFFFPPPMPVASAVWALAGLSIAAYVAWRQPVPGSECWRRLLIGKTAFSLGAMILIMLLKRHYLLTYVTPFTWMTILNPSDQHRAAQAFPRALLCFLTAVLSIYAFPVAGSQLSLIEVLLFTLVAVCGGDSLFWLGTSGIGPPWLVREWRSIAQLSLVGVVALNLLFCCYWYNVYVHLPPLDLPGARRLHVQADQKRDFQWLARNIRQSCDAFEGLPGMQSLSFWSGIDPLTGTNADDWMGVFTDSQQRAVIAALTPHARACIVYNPTLVKFWGTKAEQLESLPLVKYIQESFRTVGNSGEYYLMVRNGRDSSTVHLK